MASNIDNLSGQLNSNDYYQRLGVSEDASKQDISKAYRNIALQVHPDKNPGNKDEAEKLFDNLQKAYNTLRSDDERAKYDNISRANNDSNNNINSAGKPEPGAEPGVEPGAQPGVQPGNNNKKPKQTTIEDLGGGDISMTTNFPDAEPDPGSEVPLTKLPTASPPQFALEGGPDQDKGNLALPSPSPSNNSTNNDEDEDQDEDEQNKPQL